MHTYALSCRSATLAKAFPAISNLTSVVPHFIQDEHCEGTCNPGMLIGTKMYVLLIKFQTRKAFIKVGNQQKRDSSI